MMIAGAYQFGTAWAGLRLIHHHRLLRRCSILGFGWWHCGISGHGENSQAARRYSQNNASAHHGAPRARPRTRPAPGVGMGLKMPRFWRVVGSGKHTRAFTRARHTKFVSAYNTELAKNVLSESPPPAFPRFSCPEMNARSRAADSETRFHCADVTSTLVNVHKSQKRHQHASSLATAHRCGELANDLVLGRPGAGLTHDRYSRSRVEAGAACRWFVSFEGSFWLFRWHFSGAGRQRREAIAGWDHEPCGVSRGVGASRSRATDGRESAAVLVAHSWAKLVGLPTTSGQEATTGFLQV